MKKHFLTIPKIEFLLLFCIASFFIINNLIWITFDNHVPFSDDAEHLLRSVSYFKSFKDHDFFSLLKCDAYYLPPFYYIAVILYSFFGVIPQLAIASNVLFQIIFVFSIFKLGKRFGDSRVGLLSAFFILSYPIYFGMARVYMLDYAISSLFCLLCLLLNDPRAFFDLKRVFLAGSVFVVGCLFKPSFIIYSLVPIFISFYITHFKDYRIFCFKRAVQSLVCFFVPFLIFGCLFYLPNISSIKNAVTASINEGLYIHSFAKYSLEYFLFYFKELFNVQLGAVFTLLAFISFVFFIKKKDNTTLYFILCIVPVWIFFVFTDTKDPRFTMPVLFFFAITSARFLLSLPKKLKIIGVLFTVLFGVGYYFFVSFNFLPQFDYRFVQIKVLSSRLNITCGLHYKLVTDKSFSIQVEKMLNFLHELRGNSSLEIGLLSNNSLPLSIEALRLKSSLMNSSDNIYALCVCPKSFEKNVAVFDFIISSFEIKDNYKKFLVDLEAIRVIKDTFNDQSHVYNVEGMLPSAGTIDLTYIYTQILKNYQFLKIVELKGEPVYIYKKT